VGSAPPSEFFNPFSLILLSSLYGSGALIVRELKVRWKKTYVSMFILGSAYGVIEEGLMVKSFFDPGWMDLGILAEYGRWLGLNWVWAEWLTIYHAVFSISIPVALVELAYADRRNERWVGDRKLFALILVLGGVTALGYFALTDYRQEGELTAAKAFSNSLGRIPGRISPLPAIYGRTISHIRTLSLDVSWGSTDLRDFQLFEALRMG